MTVSTKYLAEFWGVTSRTVQNYASDKEEIPLPKLKMDEYDFAEACKWMYERQNRQIEKLERGDETLYKLQQEGQRIKNEESAIKLAKLKGELIPLRKAQEIIDDIATLLVTSLSTAELTLSPRLVDVDHKDKVKKILHESFDEIRNKIISKAKNE